MQMVEMSARLPIEKPRRRARLIPGLGAVVGGAAAALICIHSAQAGRPLVTDDASAAETATCQVEAWREQASAAHAWVVAPACGVLPGLELGADLRMNPPEDFVRSTAGVGFKWAPAAWHWDTSMGRLALGAKVGVSVVKTQVQGWRHDAVMVLGLASLQASEALTLHLNLGALRDRGSSQSATLLNTALTWAPTAHALLFVEVQTHDRPSLLGGTVRSLGGRWWWLPETLGMDLSAARCRCGGPTLWTLGLGWYGIKF